MKHSPGEFVVRFLGTNDYAWLSKGRSYKYDESDTAHKKHTSGSKASTDRQFAKGIALCHNAFTLKQFSNRRSARVVGAATGGEQSGAGEADPGKSRPQALLYQNQGQGALVHCHEYFVFIKVTACNVVRKGRKCCLGVRSVHTASTARSLETVALHITFAINTFARLH